MAMMESLLDQAVAVEKTLQMHMDHHYGDRAQMSVGPSNMNLLSDQDEAVEKRFQIMTKNL